MIAISDLIGDFSDISNDVKALFDRMDRAYDAEASTYGFVCRGCTDSCCLTLFHHHTLVEFACLHAGFATLDPEQRAAARQRAGAVNEAVAREEAAGRTPRVMCPLNSEGRCLLYAYRPMICRLHGVPHAFSHPTMGRISGPGCHEFDRLCGKKDGRLLDRTPLYREMALLEQRFRQMTGVTEKIKKTVAEILVADNL